MEIVMIMLNIWWFHMMVAKLAFKIQIECYCRLLSISMTLHITQKLWQSYLFFWGGSSPQKQTGRFTLLKHKKAKNILIWSEVAVSTLHHGAKEVLVAWTKSMTNWQIVILPKPCNLVVLIKLNKQVSKGKGFLLYDLNLNRSNRFFPPYREGEEVIWGITTSLRLIFR